MLTRTSGHSNHGEERGGPEPRGTSVARAMRRSAAARGRRPRLGRGASRLVGTVTSPHDIPVPSAIVRPTARSFSHPTVQALVEAVPQQGADSAEQRAPKARHGQAFAPAPAGYAPRARATADGQPRH